MQLLSTIDLKRSFDQHFRARGFSVLQSCPIIPSDDPTVLFVNATVTPFKSSFLSDQQEPPNVALIQRCFRLGGASELAMVGVDPYLHTFFEMFGTCMFRMSHIDAVREMLDLMALWEIDLNRLYFTIPADLEFVRPLMVNRVEESHIFVLEDSHFFWQEWRFGEGGPIGKGLTAIYDRGNSPAESIKQMAEDSERFVKLLNLIHVYAFQDRNARIAAIAHPGFDLGGGIERLAALVQGCDNYQTDAIRPLVQVVDDYFSDCGVDFDTATTRILADHLRAICVLSSEGLRPSNKKQGYALRKTIRRCLELVWGRAMKVVECSKLMAPFCKRLNLGGITISSGVDVEELIQGESDTFLSTIRRAQKMLAKNPSLDPAVLRATYGLPDVLISLSREGE